MSSPESEPSRRRGLSKSKITTFEQCPKRLWLQVHRPGEAIADESTQARFAAGREVGAVACSLCAGGVMIEVEPNLAGAVVRTNELLTAENRSAIFEATFEREGVIARVDILEPVSCGWKLAEVKSSTSVKAYHVSEVATEVWTMEASGAQLADACVRHINRDFVLEREGEYSGIFTDTSVRDLIGPIVASRGEVVDAARAVLSGHEPGQEMGDHCTDPFACEFQNYCKRGLAEPQWPISLLPNTGRKLAQKWSAEGVFELTELPAGSFTNPLHARIHQATVTGEAFHDCEAAIAATREWDYPRSWLDFETIAFAVPRWVGTRPWEQVPFQFSVHVEREDGAITHHEFLSLDGSDPRHSCAAALVRSIPASGAVVTYNASFERSCIQRLASACPGLARELDAIAARIVDLLPVARTCWYHRDQRGSWSIKSVLPTLGAELGYADLEVSEGSAAQRAYLEAIDPSTSLERRDEIDRALRAYCCRDTEAMIAVLRRFVTG